MFSLHQKKNIPARKYFKKIWCKYRLHQYLPQAQQHLVPLALNCPKNHLNILTQLINQKSFRIYILISNKLNY